MIILSPYTYYNTIYHTMILPYIQPYHHILYHYLVWWCYCITNHISYPSIYIIYWRCHVYYLPTHTTLLHLYYILYLYSPLVWVDWDSSKFDQTFVSLCSYAVSNWSWVGWREKLLLLRESWVDRLSTSPDNKKPLGKNSL